MCVFRLDAQGRLASLRFEAGLIYDLANQDP